VVYLYKKTSYNKEHMMDIKAVVFDYGGVICFLPPPETGRDLERLTGISFETLRELHRQYRGGYDRGDYAATKDYYRFILSRAGEASDDAAIERAAEAEMDGWRHINNETVRLMRDIKAAGFTLGILSNMPGDFLAWARNNIPVFGEVDVAVFSCEERLIKPEVAIYAKLKERVGFEYGEIVFFDDLPDNIAAARELGIRGFVWEGLEAARNTLRKTGKGFEAL
jgi:putative hydrolase of the HAD superfamily